MKERTAMKQERIDWMDGLKGLACIIIVIHHFILGYYPAAYLGAGGYSHCVSGADIRFAQSPLAFFTIGDFWGIELTEDERQYGLSLAMVNSEKGRELFDMAEESLVYRKERLEKALSGNPALLHPAPLSPNRKRFFELLKSRKYSEAVWETMGLGWPKWKIRAWLLQSRAYICVKLRILKRRLLP